MKTLVIGAGGVGGWFGAMLARAGYPVTLAARGEHGRILAERGLAILPGADQARDLAAENAARIRFSNVVACADGLQEQFYLVLLAVKWPELERACDPLPNLLRHDGVVLPLLNGLSSEDVV